MSPHFLIQTLNFPASWQNTGGFAVLWPLTHANFAAVFLIILLNFAPEWRLSLPFFAPVWRFCLLCHISKPNINCLKIAIIKNVKNEQ